LICCASRVAERLPGFFVSAASAKMPASSPCSFFERTRPVMAALRSAGGSGW
jgi:hypothetical protein